MNVAVVGYGIEGRVSAQYWHDKGDRVTVCDKKQDLDIPEIFSKRLGDDHLKNLHEFDIIVRTAGLRPQILLEANPDHPEIAERITTSLNEFLRVCPSRKLIGITGTKGKGTTSTLVTKILQAAGIPVRLGGNIGIAPLKMLDSVKSDDYVVLELSSFQLLDMNQRVPIAACLMMAPEHLNWHRDMDEYFEAKANLFTHQLPEDIAIYNARSEGSKRIASTSPARKIAYDVPPDDTVEPLSKEAGYVAGDTIFYQDTPIIKTSEVAMIGRHNLENMCAAISIVWPIIDRNIEAIRSVLTSFSGLAHHMEFVRELDGVKYYNDSYSTMPDATIAALKAISEPKVLILGGMDKLLPFDTMIAAVVASNVRHVLLIGSLAGRLQDMLHAQGYTATTLAPNDMPGIVAAAQKHAQPGDVVLLSPGCAAKGDGYFIDNVDRGNQYKAVIAAL